MQISKTTLSLKIISNFISTLTITILVNEQNWENMFFYLVILRVNFLKWSWDLSVGDEKHWSDTVFE